MSAAVPLSKTIAHCTLHTTISSVTSFVLAYNSGFSSFPQVTGMIVGILIFIAFMVALHRSSPFFRLSRAPYAGRAFRYTKQLRLLNVALQCVSSIGIPWVRTPFAILPDIYAGMLAVFAANAVFPEYVVRLNGATAGIGSSLIWMAHAAFATVVEGLLLAMVMGVVCLAVWMVLRLFVALTGKSHSAAAVDGR